MNDPVSGFCCFDTSSMAANLSTWFYETVAIVVAWIAFLCRIGNRLEQSDAVRETAHLLLKVFFIVFGF